MDLVDIITNNDAHYQFHVRFMCKDYKAESLLSDSLMRVSNEVSTLFPLAMLNIDPSNVMDFSSHPFRSKNDNELIVFEKNNCDVYTSSGFVCNKMMPGDKNSLIPEDDILSLAYNEQFVFKLLFLSYAKTESEEKNVMELIRHILLNADIPDVAILSIQREIITPRNDFVLAPMENYLPDNSSGHSQYPIKSAVRREPDVFNPNSNGWFDQNESAAKTMFEIWDDGAYCMGEIGIICEKSGQNSPVLDSRFSVGGSEGYFTTLIKPQAGIEHCSIVSLGKRSPLWRVSFKEDESGSEYEVARMINVPVCISVDEIFSAALSYPTQSKFGDRYGSECSTIAACADITKINQMMSTECLIERDVNADGFTVFTFIATTNQGNELPVFAGSSTQIKHFLQTLIDSGSEEFHLEDVLEVAMEMGCSLVDSYNSPLIPGEKNTFKRN
jgi:hypothetical protein